GEIAYIYDCGYILYNEKGKPYRVVGSMIDITEITEAQRELRETLDENMLLTGRLSTILNTLPAQIALLDSDGSILDVNDEWKSFTMECGFAGKQYGIGEDYIAFSGDSLGGEVEKSMVSEGIRRVLEGRTEEFVHEYFCPRCKKQQWFKMVVTPLKGKENNGAVVMHIDISEIKRLEEERIKSKTEEQRKITEAMLKGQEKERNAIGIELHDNVNQILVGTKVLLSVVRDFPDKREELVPSCIDNINMAIQENRKIAHELVTPNLSNEDLIKQIRRLGDTMLKNAGINAHIKHDRFNEELLNNDMKLAVYRVAQEQCTNIIKYADAGHVVFSLKTADNHFFMRITDDGKGMDKENVTHGIGLKNIASRLGVFGGTINVETEPGEGFTLEIDIPLNNISEQEVSPSVP
ncbi:MAG TPA: histidine kinase, partial [Chitinophagaceae bacterium]|nr:histidine kinase [Chitinophagaceae bacterium]HMU57685.1 histidine kinase [Chitinophagaceae bacterium]